MDLTLRNAVTAERHDEPFDIGIKDGMIVAMQPCLLPGENDIDLAGKLVTPGFVESHIHLDKSCILDRCQAVRGDLDEAIEQVSQAKANFTEDDVAKRAAKSLEKCILNGTGFMRTQVEVDPVIGLRGLRGVQQAIKKYAWAIDVEICVFPQEGLLNYPGTEELMIESLQSGATIIGAAPYTDKDPHGQINRIFELAEKFDVDIDMHLDFSLNSTPLDVAYVCDKVENTGWSGRVTVGHVTKLSVLPPEKLARIAGRMAETGVALTVMPSTDLFLMGREYTEKVPRGLTPAHILLKEGVTCSISTNNILNPFTPFGDGSLLRMANLFANICQIGKQQELEDCFKMITSQAAVVMNKTEYGIDVGHPADIVVVDASAPAMAVAEISNPVYGFKAGIQTFYSPGSQIAGKR